MSFVITSENFDSTPFDLHGSCMVEVEIRKPIEVQGSMTRFLEVITGYIDVDMFHEDCVRNFDLVFAYSQKHHVDSLEEVMKEFRYEISLIRERMSKDAQAQMNELTMPSKNDFDSLAQYNQKVTNIINHQLDRKFKLLLWFKAKVEFSTKAALRHTVKELNHWGVKWRMEVVHNDLQRCWTQSTGEQFSGIPAPEWCDDKGVIYWQTDFNRHDPLSNFCDNPIQIHCC